MRVRGVVKVKGVKKRISPGSAIRAPRSPKLRLPGFTKKGKFPSLSKY